MVLLYKDLAKTADDLLTDDYDYSRKLKVKSKAANGVTFTTEGEMGSNKAISAKLTSSFAHSGTGVVFKKLRVTTQGRLITEAELPDIFTKGLKLTIDAEGGAATKTTPSKRAAVLGLEYKKGSVALDCHADLKTNTLRESAVYAYNHFRFGAQAAFSVDKKTLTEDNVALSYKASDFTATLQTKKKFNALTGSFFHRLSKDTIYAAMFDYDLKSGANHLTVGGRYHADPLTTYAGKVESDGHVSLVLIQNIRPFLQLTTSAHIDARNFDGDAHKFGIGLTLG